jgi:hypothetical protein
VGWSGELSRIRRFRGGASLAISAPIDTLFAATEVNEWALASANAALGAPAQPLLAVAAERLRDLIAAERKPALLALARAARRNGVTFLADDEQVSVGTGTGSMTWPITGIPSPADIDWAGVHDVPTVLVTGANGKTTTVRLLSAVLTSAGRVTGMSCSDSVSVAKSWTGRLVRAGAPRCSRPSGAGGVLDRPWRILRRSAVTRADAAIITNVAEHFGEYGSTGRAHRASCSSPRLAVRAGAQYSDPSLVSWAMLATAYIVWLTLDPDNPWSGSWSRAEKPGSSTAARSC